jgi:hydroxymethylpyrimidine/phosphomethylpyrimidine kinase
VNPTPPIAVAIAGSDSSAGAGLEADLKTFSSLGVYAAIVVTAVTAQNTRGVRAVHVVPPEHVAAQIDAVFEDLAPRAVKIGMLADRATIAAVAEGLERWSAREIVLDPVMVAKGGAALLAPAAVSELTARLVPKARVITPNLPEAAALLGVPVGEVLYAPEEAVRALAKLGARAVVLKGGHAGGSYSEDLFFDADGATSAIERFGARRIATDNTHGTGCTFASAIAAGLAHGRTLRDSVAEAKAFVTRAIERAAEQRIGSGHGPVDLLPEREGE